MGRRGRGGGKGRGRGRDWKGNGGGGRTRGDGQQSSYNEVVPENALYEKYYIEGGFVPKEQTPELFETLRRILPNSFRFTGSKGHALPVLKKLKSHFIPLLQNIVVDGQPVDPPTPLSWYPNEMGWSMTTPKSVLRRHPAFSEFQRFLVSETGVGNISRQEAVSMIPPMVLDVHPGMTVLDLCAAPGSKTAQLIEMVHGGEESRTRKVVNDLRKKEGRAVSPDTEEDAVNLEDEEKDGDWSDYGRSTGLVVANDVDYKRSHLLIHQTKRLNSPNIIVTNHDATMFPSIKIGSEKDNSGREINKYLKFDRVLADVPCSGDGTARKNPNVWKDWNPGNAFGLHPVQARILVRALQMLKVGGRVVYSTCSMHPVENEAVVASVIDRCGGLDKVELLDSTNMLPELKRSPGLRSWKVMDKVGRLWDSWDSVMKQKEEAGVEGLGKMSHSMFADYTDGTLPMERCMRVYPHQQDTGGFFIAVLEKKAEIRARPEGQARPGHAAEVAADLRTEKALQNGEAREEPKSSILAIVDELEATKADTEDTLPHIEAADQVLPPSDSHDLELQNSVVSFEHPLDSPAPLAGQKRVLEDPEAVLAATKKVKIHGENGFSGHQSLEAEAVLDEDRQVHWPPPPAAVDPGGTKDIEKPKRQDRFFEEPFNYLQPDQEDLKVIYDFYGVDPKFPRDRFLVRNAEGVPAKGIYYTSALAKIILQENEGKGFKFVHCGIKVFVKQDVPRPDICRWRIQTDGMQLLEPWISEQRILHLKSKKIFHKMLREMFPKVSGLAYQDLGELGEVLREKDLGCYALIVEAGEGEDAFEERMILPLWRSIASVNVMLPKEERKAMLLRLYNDNSPLIDHSQQNNRDRINQAAEAAQQESEKSPAALNVDDEEEDGNESDGGVELNGNETAGDKRRELETSLGEVSSGIDERYAAEQVKEAV